MSPENSHKFMEFYIDFSTWFVLLQLLFLVVCRLYRVKTSHVLKYLNVLTYRLYLSSLGTVLH